MSTEQDNNLLDFNWEEDTADFFGIKEDSTKELEEVKKPKVEAKVEAKTEVKVDAKVDAKVDEEEEIEEDFTFGDTELDDEENLEDKPGSTTLKGDYVDMYKQMKESSILKHVEAETDSNIDLDFLAELQEEDYEIEVSQRLKSWATEELDKDAQDFIKFKRNNGSTADYIEHLKNQSGIPEGDISDEEYQDDLIRYQLNKEGWDKDEIEDRLEYLSSSNKKQATASKYEVKVKEEQATDRQILLKQAEDNLKKQKDTEQSFKDTLQDSLKDAKEIKGFKIAEVDKDKIYNYLTKKDHKVSNAKSITNFQRDLAGVFQDSDKIILLAKILESDFDMSDFTKSVVTNKTREIKKNLEQRKNNRPSSGSSSQKVSLADLFD